LICSKRIQKKLNLLGFLGFENKSVTVWFILTLILQGWHLEVLVIVWKLDSKE